MRNAREAPPPPCLVHHWASARRRLSRLGWRLLDVRPAAHQRRLREGTQVHCTPAHVECDSHEAGSCSDASARGGRAETGALGVYGNER